MKKGLDEILQDIDAGVGYEAWEALDRWYKRFMSLNIKYPYLYASKNRQEIYKKLHLIDALYLTRRDILAQI